jgi:hypothetical protein
LHTSLILLNRKNIVCISFSAAPSLGYLIRKLKEKRLEKKTIDPIVTELKSESSVIAVSLNGKPLKLPIIRRGDGVQGWSLVVESKKLVALIKVIGNTKKIYMLLTLFFALLNASLTSSVGLRFVVGGSLDYTQFIIIALPATVGGFFMKQVSANPLASIFLPLAILYGGGIEDIPDPHAHCKQLSKIAEEFHNKQLEMEMREFGSFLDDVSIAL